MFFIHTPEDTLSMDWINCNMCCRQPGDDKDMKFTLSSCGHIFCDPCLAKGRLSGFRGIRDFFYSVKEPLDMNGFISCFVFVFLFY